MRKAGAAVFVFLSIALASGAAAQDNPRLQAVQNRLDSAMALGGNIFAPETYAKAKAKADGATEMVKLKKNTSVIDKYLTEAEELTENTFKATEVAKLTFREYLGPRDKAIQAKAPKLVPELYQKAEDAFSKAAGKVESGDVKGGLKDVALTGPLFDTAELEAIKVDIMGTADALIAKATAGDAAKYAMSTLDKAKTSRAKCDAILSKDRYERSESIKAIGLAEYEARHAANIAQSVRSLERNDQAWEKLMLVYEIQMDRVGAKLGMDYVPFDNGPEKAADTLIRLVELRRSQSQDAGQRTHDLTDKLTALLGVMNLDQSTADPATLVDRLDGGLRKFIVERDRLASEVDVQKSQLSQLQQSNQEVTVALQERTDQEEKFKKAKAILGPSDGEVLYNASNDLILRLTGLSFDINKSDIKNEHVPLLDKVKAIIEMFPDNKIAVEGHTDASGDPSANTQLSEKRAYAVMQYLRQSMLLSADRISAIGYGSEKPVASNTSSEGRAKNRRIDIVIMK